jgi:sporulation protein YlmC with PRC-barrel domain
MNKSVFALSTALSILAFTPAFAQETAPAPAAQVDCSQAVNANDPACVNQNNNATTGQSGTDATTDTTGSTAPVDPAANDATKSMSGNSLIVPADRVNGMQFITASDFIGKRVYDTNGENIGEVNDMILSAEGDTRAIILGVGGFLGIGEKDVAVSVDAVKIVQDGDSQRLVVEATKEMLENAPTYDRNTRGYAESGANAPATTGTGTTTTTTEQPPAQPAQ